jgi:hypothetical protein
MTELRLEVGVAGAKELEAHLAAPVAAGDERLVEVSGAVGRRAASLGIS